MDAEKAKNKKENVGFEADYDNTIAFYLKFKSNKEEVQLSQLSLDGDGGDVAPWTIQKLIEYGMELEKLKCSFELNPETASIYMIFEGSGVKEMIRERTVKSYSDEIASPKFQYLEIAHKDVMNSREADPEPPTDVMGVNIRN